MGSKCNRKTTTGVPLGFRFQPTEEELVNHYLNNKKEDKDFNVDHIIPVIDVCKYDPWDLPALLLKQPDSPHQDMEWFFYNPRDYKYINSTRSNRYTPGGYWKITGKQRVIRARRSRTVIGKKRTLTFYQGRAPNSRKTNWVKHEYDRTENDAVPNPNLAQRDFVLCHLKNKSDEKDTSVCTEGEPSSYSMPAHEDQAGTTELFPMTLPLPTVSSALTVQLDGNNYQLWIAQIVPLLKSHRLMSFIDGCSPCPSAFILDKDEKPTDAVNPAFEDWIQKDQMVLSWIKGSLSHSILATVAHSISARDTWITLEERYASQNQNRICVKSNTSSAA